MTTPHRIKPILATSSARKFLILDIYYAEIVELLGKPNTTELEDC